MNIELGEDPRVLANTALDVVPVFAGEPVSWPHQPKAFSAGVGELTFMQVIAGDDARDIALLGLGRRAAFDAAAALAAGKALGAAIESWPAVSVDLVNSIDLDAHHIGRFAEGLELGHFRIGVVMPATIEVPIVFLAVPQGEGRHTAYAFALERAAILARNTNWVRELVEMPPSDLTPEVLAEFVVDRAKALGVAFEILDSEHLAKRGFGGTLGVGAGSPNSPVAVVLRAGKRGPGASVLGLAGKGVTFDSGGINLKRDAVEIAYMKSDMAGAASVAAAIFTAVECGHSPDVTAILPMAENMPGGGALKPGDVVTHPDGRRTEVIDTDCEGRLLLADAIAWLVEDGADEIVDVGTLSDGGGVGPLLWGMWSNSDPLAKALSDAGDKAVDPGWRLPLRDEYEAFIRSRIADSANAPSGTPDTGLMAATFLSRFAGGVPWAHIDNGSSAYLLDACGAWHKGATGSPTRALFQFLSDRDSHDT